MKAAAGGADGQPIIPATNRASLLRAFLALGCLCLLYLATLLNLFRFSLSSELYSHIPLVPLIVAYLLWGERAKFASTPPSRSPTAAGLAFLVGIGFFIASQFGIAAVGAYPGIPQDRLCLATLSFLACAFGCALYFLGWSSLRQVAFPLGLLLLMAPLPLSWERGAESFLQEASADAAALLFRVVGAPVVRNGLVFDLPDLPIQVARECSGIRSSLVLVITGLIAAYLFLRSPVRRSALVLLTIPLGIVRNGFRIFVIGELCINWGPEMLNSWVHKKGGPLFFVLSLGILWVLLALLRKGERDRGERSGSPSAVEEAGKSLSAAK